MIGCIVDGQRFFETTLQRERQVTDDRSLQHVRPTSTVALKEAVLGENRNIHIRRYGEVMPISPR